jgi:hypothetical protein
MIYGATKAIRERIVNAQNFLFPQSKLIPFSTYQNEQLVDTKFKQKREISLLIVLFPKKKTKVIIVGRNQMTHLWIFFSFGRKKELTDLQYLQIY